MLNLARAIQVFGMDLGDWIRLVRRSSGCLIAVDEYL